MANLIQTSQFWKDIDGFEGIYQVSTVGVIRALPRIVKTKTYSYFRSLHELKAVMMKNGYLTVTLAKNSTLAPTPVHRIVATAFIENPNGLEQINHINGIKTDNRVENLEWCSRSYNMHHAYDTGLIKKGKKII